MHVKGLERANCSMKPDFQTDDRCDAPPYAVNEQCFNFCFTLQLRERKREERERVEIFKNFIFVYIYLLL